MDDAETKTKRNRVATDQSAAFLCKVGAAGDWNGRGSIESIRPGDRLSRSSRKLSAIAPLSTLPAIPSTRFLFSPLPRAIFPPRSHMLIVIPCFISRLPSSADYISRIYIFGYRGFWWLARGGIFCILFLDAFYVIFTISMRPRVEFAFIFKFLDIRPSSKFINYLVFFFLVDRPFPS